MCLTGYALDEYNAAPRELREPVEGANAPTVTALFTNLERELGVMRNDRLGKAEFRSLRQHPEETLREFARRVRNIGKIAYSEKDPDTKDELFREKFLEGLSDGQLEAQLLKENPRTFGELVNRAADLEVIAKTTRDRNELRWYSDYDRPPGSSPGALGFSTEPWKEELQQLTTRMDQMTQLMMKFMANVSKNIQPRKLSEFGNSYRNQVDHGAIEQKINADSGFRADRCSVCDGFWPPPSQCPKRMVLTEDSSWLVWKLTRESSANRRKGYRGPKEESIGRGTRCVLFWI